jgi:MFS family permease
MATSISQTLDDAIPYKTHEGEHHGDFSGFSLKVTRSTVLFAACAALNSCNLGYDIGVSTNAGSLIQKDLGLTDVQRQLFVGSLNFWSIFGSLFSHWICDVYGRRKAFQVAAVSFIAGLIIMAAANGFAVLVRSWWLTFHVLHLPITIVASSNSHSFRSCFPDGGTFLRRLRCGLWIGGAYKYC